MIALGILIGCGILFAVGYGLGMRNGAGPRPGVIIVPRGPRSANPTSPLAPLRREGGQYPPRLVQPPMPRPPRRAAPPTPRG